MVADLVFYLFSTIAVLAAIMVVSVSNPVHSVLFLVLTFFNVSALFVLLDAEFLAAILILVYMGAVAMLFLFVVMMLDVEFIRLREGVVQYLPSGLLIGFVVLVELIIAFATSHVGTAHVAAVAGEVQNTVALGQLLYTKYLYPFELASLVLLVAMVGAIVLTLRERTGRLRQDVSKQIARTRDEALALVKKNPGEGA